MSLQLTLCIYIYCRSILRELTETDLEVMSSIRIINGFVRIQSNRLKNLSFLRNLEVIRANNLV